MTRILIITFAFYLSGCASQYLSSSYGLGVASQYSLEGESETVCTKLATIANEYGFERQNPKKEETFCYFSGDKRCYEVIGARQKEERLVIDSQSFNCFNEERFQQIDEEIKKMLDEDYPGNYEAISTY
ncbi:hypothetical protein [Reinekea sp. G2M2-21]|uniref:hypothetical protein n=1 Tax=Reinekea sp. G2M2-21 TaxID=2788942 RepID=UPI0018A8F7BF|nr:hypothetical protein [Reinekea sp. G2M2-21]